MSTQNIYFIGIAVDLFIITPLGIIFIKDKEDRISWVGTAIMGCIFWPIKLLLLLIVGAGACLVYLYESIEKHFHGAN